MTDPAAARHWLRQQVQRLRPKPAGVAPSAAAPPKPSVAVVTDSAAALPPEWVLEFAAQGLLTVVPMPVIIGDNVYSDDDAELETHISLALASGQSVKTSRPSPGQFERAYKNAAAAGFDAVVSVHISTKLSGTFDAAQLGAERAPIPVHVLDSGTVGMGQGCGVQAAISAAAAGAGTAGVMAAATTALAATAIYFYVPSLEQLRRGGRISMASSWLGTVLDIKPILGIRDGAVVPLEKVRSAVRAIARLEVLAAADVAARGAQTTQISVHHFGNEPQARELGESLAARSPGLAAATLTRLPAVLAAHAGLGVLVVVVADAPAEASGDDPARSVARPQAVVTAQAVGGARPVGTAQAVGTAQRPGAPVVAAHNFGTPDLGTSEIGARELGPRDVGSPEPTKAAALGGASKQGAGPRADGDESTAARAVRPHRKARHGRVAPPQAGPDE